MARLYSHILSFLALVLVCGGARVYGRTLLDEQAPNAKQPTPDLIMIPVATIQLNAYNPDSAEKVAYDSDNKVAYVIGSPQKGGDNFFAISLENPFQPEVVQRETLPAGASDVALCRDYVAVSTIPGPGTIEGVVMIFTKYKSASKPATLVQSIKVGSGPDQILFSKDCTQLFTANEGEPSGDDNPEGSVSIITFKKGSKGIGKPPINNQLVSFASLNGNPAVRKARPGDSEAQNFEPEYLALSEDGKTLFVNGQESNAIAYIDIDSATVVKVESLGLKDWSAAGGTQGLDATDKPAAIRIRNELVSALYQPDEIKYFTDKKRKAEYLAMANEGDADVEDKDSIRVKDKKYVLDTTVYPAADVKADENLGRLTVSTVDGDTNGDGKIDRITTFGGRSFSIRKASNMTLVFDSGSQFEQRLAAQFPDQFNTDPGDIIESTPLVSIVGQTLPIDVRSDNKGPEPASMDVAELPGLCKDRRFLFQGLERPSFVLAYDISDPAAPVFQAALPGVVLDSQTKAVTQVRFVKPEGVRHVRIDGLNFLLISGTGSGHFTVVLVDCGVPKLPKRIVLPSP